MDNKDQKNLAYLWMKACPSVEYYLLSLIRDKDKVDDVLQQVAMTVTEEFDQYDPSRPFVAWCLGIARNMALLHFRRTKADRHRFDVELIHELTKTQLRVSDEIEVQADALKGCMYLLNKRSKSLLHRRYYMDMKPAAIAEDLGVSANSISVSLHKIRKILADCIKEKMAKEA